MYEGNQSLKKATAGNGTGTCAAPSSGTPPPGKTGGGYYFLKSFGKCSSALSQNKESKFTVPVHLSGRKITPRLLTPNFESIPAGKKLNDIPGQNIHSTRRNNQLVHFLPDDQNNFQPRYNSKLGACKLEKANSNGSTRRGNSIPRIDFQSITSADPPGKISNHFCGQFSARAKIACPPIRAGSVHGIIFSLNNLANKNKTTAGHILCTESRRYLLHGDE